MKSVNLVITFLLGILSGCASSNEPEVLPGIPADARLIDLDTEQGQTLCEFMLEAVGADPATGGRRMCTNGYEAVMNSLEGCVTDVGTLPERAPDCPTLVRSEVNFWTNIRDNCDSPDFDPSRLRGSAGMHRALTRPSAMVVFAAVTPIRLTAAKTDTVHFNSDLGHRQKASRVAATCAGSSSCG